MKKNLLFVLITLASFTNVFSQEKRDYIWTIGDNVSDGTIRPDFGGVNINFSSNILELQKVDRQGMSFGSNSSSITKSNELLFYTDGCYVFGGNNESIKDGDIINNGDFKNRCTWSSSP